MVGGANAGIINRISSQKHQPGIMTGASAPGHQHLGMYLALDHAFDMALSPIVRGVVVSWWAWHCPWPCPLLSMSPVSLRSHARIMLYTIGSLMWANRGANGDPGCNSKQNTTFVQRGLQHSRQRGTDPNRAAPNSTQLRVAPQPRKLQQNEITLNVWPSPDEMKNS